MSFWKVSLLNFLPINQGAADCKTDNVPLGIIKYVFFCCHFGIRESKLHMAMIRRVISVRPTPFQNSRSMALSAMAFECE